MCVNLDFFSESWKEKMQKDGQVLWSQLKIETKWNMERFDRHG